ncbi:MAG: hypothetical protein IPF68_03515 [Bacteroidales bacterium]|nr:hypothetical protein [Bacteroidales bacterium]
MDIDDLYNDVFDETPIKEDYDVIEYHQWFFPIIGYSILEKEKKSHGNGFFINNMGYFVTAGHVIHDKTQHYKAIIDNNECDFIILFEEYLPIKEQNNQLCKDLAICKIEINKENNFQLSNILASEMRVAISGFRRRIQNGISINPIKVKEFYLHNYKCIDVKLNLPREINNDIDNRPVCHNTRSLVLTEGVKYNGLSGCCAIIKNG